MIRPASALYLLGCGLVLVGCAARAPGPRQVFDDMVEASPQGAGAVEERLSSGSVEALEEYHDLALALSASNLPINPTEVLAAQFETDRPVALSERKISPDTVWVAFRYQDGGDGEVRFIREDGRWMFDLAREMASAMDQMRRASRLIETIRHARDTGQSVEMPEDDDD